MTAHDESPGPHGPTHDDASEWRPLHVGNLIYLPFARHLAAEDEAETNAEAEVRRAA